jgi:large subunit ribosomal protein L24e
MVKCTFCGNTIEKGTGKMYIQKDAKILYFCSSKCEKNLLKLKRKPITTRWSSRYHKTGKKVINKKEINDKK